MDNCIFCKIVSDQVDAYKLYEDDKVLVFLDNNPDYNGHALIIPKKHLVDTKDILKEDGLLEHIINIAENIRRELEEKMGVKGMTYLWNMDNAQDIKHFHLHIIPRDKSLKEHSKLLPLDEVYNKIKK